MRASDAVFIDRAPQIAKLRFDLETSTTNAEQTGVALADIVLALLQRADAIAERAIEAGADMSALEGVLP